MDKNTEKLFLFFLICGLWVTTILTASEPVENIPDYMGYSNQQLSSAMQAEKPVSDSTEIEHTSEKLFGMQFFDRFRSEQTALTGGTVTPEYPLGPGDMLGIYLGDKAQQEFQVRVSADGKVYVPTVGLFDVNGQTIRDFQTDLDKRLQRLYNNYIVDIMLITPKRIRVSIVGEVKAPGNYSLNALNTALDAILTAGGPTDYGSLRNIKLFRNDSCLGDIDLYTFLLSRENPEHIYLQNDDRLYVPVRKSVVNIEGKVHRNGVFELSEAKPERILDVLDLAGGMTDMALRSNVELGRLNADGSRKVFYLNLDKIKDNVTHPDNLQLHNNDRIVVYSIMDTMQAQYVFIYGQVRNPGIFEFQENMRVSDLVLKAGGLTRNAYMLDAYLAKVDPQRPFTPHRFDLQEVLSGNNPDQDFLLEPDDQVFIREIPEWQVGPLVEVTGEVKFPGLYPIVKDSTTLSQVVIDAGGITADANLSEATLVRKHTISVIDKEFERLQNMSRSDMTEHEYQYYVMKQSNQDMNTIIVDFHKLLNDKDLSCDVVLEDGDVVNIPEMPKVVWVTGRVANAGGILFDKDANLDYYIDRAGGYSWDSDPGDTKVIKVTGEIIERGKVRHFSPGDRIWVPRKPERNYWEIFRDIMLVAGQVATIYLVVDRAMD